ncbi:MAG: D-alanyl-D-alanine carboxypeptidase family protein, partial [Actinomycetota bacterium]
MTATGLVRHGSALWQLRRRAPRHPVQHLAALAARSPRTALMVGGVGLGSMAVILLLAVSSVQAFLVLSGQSSVMADQRVVLFGSGGDDGPTSSEAAVAAGAAVALASGASLATPSGQQPTEPVTIDETVVVEGIRVHTSIQANLQGLLDKAAADGVNLSGWGWRDTQAQIRLRRQHCGTTEYAIYRMPSGQCSPPTARPGSSQHERGLAIDFTYNGGSISTRRSPGSGVGVEPTEAR